MKYLLLAVTIMLCSTTSANAQTQIETEESIRAATNVEFYKNMADCDSEVDAVTDFNEKTEFWSICDLDNDNRIIKVKSYNDNTYYQETYFEENKLLVYAIEAEYYIPKNSFIQQVWNCEFYIDNGKLVTLMSLGHGKTETEDWDPGIIFSMYEARLNELSRIKP